ncbi:MAG TPA: CHAT domain-containing protein, partial [Planctomycetota bacterium]|nr:CHAT domain-containing protein [Planctomycetota bacterium]
PSASAFLELRKHPRSASPGVLVFDPILSDDPKSPFAKTESLGLRSQYAGGTFVLRRAATLAAFKEHAPGAGVIHVSSHGYYDEWIPMESGLVFAGPGGKGDELLRVRDIYGMHLDRTELLIMSACVSSVGDFAKGDEVTGLTRAFQVAGIPNVIGSLWPVENDATIELMTILHRSLAESRNPAVSLRRAQCELIGKKLTIDRWAAFELTGIGDNLSLGGK